MKRILLLLFVFSFLSELKASDTLTIRQIYNFDVGDTFDYFEYGVQGGFPTPTRYFTTVIVGKTLMTDTVMYIFSETDIMGNETVWVSNLDSDAINVSFPLLFSTYSNFNNNGGGLLPFINIAIDTVVGFNGSHLIDSASRKYNYCYPQTYIPNWDSAGNDVNTGGYSLTG